MCIFEIMEKLVHKGYWNQHRVEIIDSGDFRSLYFGSGYLQSRMSLSCPHTLVLSYTHFMAFGLLFCRSPRQILIVGVGSGSLVRFLHHTFPSSRIDAVDYSPHIIKLAKGYFCLPQSPLVNIHCADGYDFLRNNNRTYDMIFVDAFDDQGMAPTVYQKPFFELCENSLTPEGVASLNLWSSKKKVFRQIKNELTDIFAGLIFLQVPDRGNIVALTMKKELPIERLYLDKKEMTSLSKQFQLNFIQMAKIAKQNSISLKEKVKLFLR